MKDTANLGKNSELLRCKTGSWKQAWFYQVAKAVQLPFYQAHLHHKKRRRAACLCCSPVQTEAFFAVFIIVLCKPRGDQQTMVYGIA